MTGGHLDKLVAHASDWAGFRVEAISPSAIERSLRESALAKLPEAELLARARVRDPELGRVIARAIGTGETYFFRHPEHFELLGRDVLPARFARREYPVRGWSAGCATGEEAYSLAACLLEIAGKFEGAKVEVLGTDMVDEYVQHAARGRYGNWSLRVPIPEGLLMSEKDGTFSISDRIRNVTHVRTNNLLDLLPEHHGLFDVVMCRNVLVYLRDEVARAVIHRLASAVAPGGALVFATMDIDHVPQGFVRAQATNSNVFIRVETQRAERDSRPSAGASVRSDSPPLREHVDEVRIDSTNRLLPAPQSGTAAHPVATHVRALTHVENGERAEATRLLSQLTKEAPDYVPGLLERALLHIREGEPNAASALMNEILRRTEHLDTHAILKGPLELPASYYREAARAFLGRRRR